MTAAVRIESRAWNDLRFAALARLVGLVDADHALIKVARLWSWQTEHYKPERPTYVVKADIIEGALGPGGATAMVRAGLATETFDGYRIHGTEGQIEWRAGLSSTRQRAGQARAARARRGPDGRWLSKIGEVHHKPPACGPARPPISGPRARAALIAEDRRTSESSPMADAGSSVPAPSPGVADDPAWAPALDEQPEHRNEIAPELTGSAIIDPLLGRSSGEDGRDQNDDDHEPAHAPVAGPGPASTSPAQPSAPAPAPVPEEELSLPHARARTIRASTDHVAPCTTDTGKPLRAARPSEEPGAILPERRKGLRRALWSELETARRDAAAELGVRAQPLLAFDPGETALAARIAATRSEGEIREIASQARHAIACAKAEALRDDRRSVQWLTGVIFEDRNWRRFAGMTLEDARSVRASPRGRAPLDRGPPHRPPERPNPLRPL